jgi:hypothetical protein
MADIACLYLEDKEKSYKRYSKEIDVRWKKVTGGSIRFDYVSEVSVAIERLATAAPGTYQLFISDLLFPPVSSPRGGKQLPLGLEAVECASKKSGMVVVALSVGDVGQYPHLGEDAKANGADLFRYLGEFFGSETSIERFCRELYDRLVDKKILKDSIEFAYDLNDPRLAYIVEEIGEATLRSLYKRVLGGNVEIESVRVSYLAPGMSGAFVLRMECRLKNGAPLTHLLKISRNKARLQQEIARCPRNGPYSTRLVVVYPDAIATLSDWHAICAGFEKETVPLRKWLAPPHTDDEIIGIMRVLFLDGGLKEGYRTDLAKRVGAKSAVHVLTPNLSRRARIFQAMADLSEVLKAPTLGRGGSLGRNG